LTGSALTGKQARPLAGLIEDRTIEAAAAARVNPATLHRWLSEPAFSQAYRAARRQVVSQTIGRVQAGAADAALVRRLIARDADAPASSRVAAARALLDLALQSGAMDDLARRLEVRFSRRLICATLDLNLPARWLGAAFRFSCQPMVLHQHLFEKVNQWREAGYPCKPFPAGVGPGAGPVR
jgi:hypothetical protein